MRILNPQTIDEQLISEQIERGKGDPVIQFDNAAAYGGSILLAVDRACRSFGARLHIRFYGHYFDQNTFNCDVLRFIPNVRSLGIDCLLHVVSHEAIGQLTQLEELRFGVFEADLPNFLAMPNLFKLRKLTVGDTRKSNIDLVHLAAFENLERLILSGQARGIAATTHLRRLARLGIYCFGKKIDLQFLNDISNLEVLRILLGGRSNIDEVSIPTLRWLMIDRVLGFGQVDLSRFPNLTELTVEDQLQLREIDLTPLAGTLSRLRLWNCKNLDHLVGLNAMAALLQLRIGQTALDLEQVIANLPERIRGVSLYGKGSRNDAQIRTRLEAAGYPESSYAIDPFFP